MLCSGIQLLIVNVCSATKGGKRHHHCRANILEIIGKVARGGATRLSFLFFREIKVVVKILVGAYQTSN